MTTTPRDAMTPEELDRLQALADAATPGPWNASTEACGCVYGADRVIFEHGDESYGQSSHDAEFAAAARAAVPALIAALRDAQAEVASLRTLRMEIDQGISGPATIKVWRDNVLRFNGVDYSALMERDDLQRRIDAVRAMCDDKTPGGLAAYAGIRAAVEVRRALDGTALETSGVGSKETGTVDAPSADDPPAAPEPRCLTPGRERRAAARVAREGP